MVERQLPKLNVAGSSPVIRSIFLFGGMIVNYTYTPYGVCSRLINIELDENNVIKNCGFIGGCSGNTQGVSRLVIGMNAEDAIKRLKGIDCAGRGTSCPDQLAKALEQALERN